MSDVPARPGSFWPSGRGKPWRIKALPNLSTMSNLFRGPPCARTRAGERTRLGGALLLRMHERFCVDIVDRLDRSKDFRRLGASTVQNACGLDWTRGEARS